MLELLLDNIIPRTTVVVELWTVYSVSSVVLKFASFVILKVLAIYSFHPSATLKATTSSIVTEAAFQVDAEAI